MKNLFVTGIDTGVGKTIVSALLTEALQADYWKPVQAGDLDNSDTLTVKSLVSNSQSRFHKESYALQRACSPHAAAATEGIDLSPDAIHVPPTDNKLIVEGAGGLCVPLNNQHTIADVIVRLDLPVLLVVKNYLGSINHTLLSINYLRQRNIPLTGIIVSGAENSESEQVIKEMSGGEILFHLPHAESIDRSFIKEQATLLADVLQRLNL